MFLIACETYFQLRPHEFQSEQDKIRWALTFMTQGRAAEWVQTWSRHGSPLFLSWIEFRAAFKLDFFPLSEAEDVMITLVGKSYFQGERSLEEYVDGFQQLVHCSHWTDLKYLVLHFRHGLDPSLEETISTTLVGCPDE